MGNLRGTIPLEGQGRMVPPKSNWPGGGGTRPVDESGKSYMNFDQGGMRVFLSGQWASIAIISALFPPPVDILIFGSYLQLLLYYR